MRGAAASLAVLLSSTWSLAATAQTQIGSWKFQEAALSPSPDTYFISSSIGEVRGDTYSEMDLYCDKGKYKFTLMPPIDRSKADFPDGSWTVQILINNQIAGILSAKSDMGMLSAPVPIEIILALDNAKARPPAADVLTAMLEKTDGGRIQRAINYPATRFRAAVNFLADACRADR